MKYYLLKLLLCPICKGNLELKVFSIDKKNEEIKQGLLLCSNNHWFPVINAIPRMLSKDYHEILYRHHKEYFETYSEKIREITKGGWIKGKQSLEKRIKKTLRSFGFEWTKFSDYSADNFLDFIRPLELSSFKGKWLMDLGCGAGRHLQQVAQFCTGAIGVDLSEAVQAAFYNTKGSPNVHIVQADIYNLPFSKNSFDFIYSLGVIHHLPNPKKGFNTLIPFLRQNGAVLIWVYKESLRKKVLSLAKVITKRSPEKLIYYISYVCACIDYFCFVKPYIFCKKKLPSLALALDAFIVSHIKAYARYDFKVSLTDWYDRLATPIANFYSEANIKDWFKEAGLKNIDISSYQDFWVRGYGERN